MRRGSMLVLVLTMVFSLLAIVPVAAVTTPQSDTVVWQESEAQRVVENRFKKAGDGVWVIHFEEAPVASYDGTISGYAPTATEETGAFQLDTASPAAVNYAGLLEQRQAKYTTAIESSLGRSLTIRHEYLYAANGIATYMTWEEASKAARVEGVKSVLKDTRHKIDTDNGPKWIGAESAWDGTSASPDTGTEGEGIIVGVLDTGINPSNPSFADIGPEDAHNHDNPWGSGVYVGVCDSTDPSYDASFPCNDKLIGAWSLVPSSPFGGIDDDGHGSHTASTAAGNYVDAAVVGPTITKNRDISGVAPHANIISYDVCDGDGCNGTAILAGIDQAIDDGVDVINYSIGSEDPSDPWTSSDDLGFLQARAAGIFVAHSAGNEGPGAATVGSPMAPWMTHVAASTHDRKYVNALINLSGGDTTPPDDLIGLGFTSASAADMEIVYAGDYPVDVAGGTANLCGAGNQLDFISPWDPGTFTSDQIVVCDRGTYGRVEKGANVLAAGAGGFVLADNGSGLSGDAHDLPAVHISQTDGDALKAWLASGTGHTGQIQGATLDVDAANGDIIAGFSSRGPNRSADFLAPSIAAPGVDIIAAYGTGDPVDGEWNFVSGTSMASPHVAGVAALFKVLRPDWNPAELQSALMMTANTTMLKEDGVTAADPFDMGSGRVDIVAADNAGLIMDETTSNYEDADPSGGSIDVSELNLASMSEDKCVLECSWTRTFTGTGSADWTIGSVASGGMVLSANPSNFSITDGGTQVVTFTADVSGSAANTYHFGEFQLTNSSTFSDANLPVAVQPTTGELPDLVKITTARDHGSWLVEDLEALEITDFHTEIMGLVKGDPTTESLVEDPTSTDVYDDMDQLLVDIVNVPSGSVELIAEVIESAAPDLDLYVGFDANTDGIPQESEEVCSSASGTALEKCKVDPDGNFGDYWVIIQNWAEPATGATHEFTYVTAVVGDTDEGNMSVVGPNTVPELQPFDITVLFDLPGSMAGDRYYGEVSVGTSPGNAGNLGSFPVEVMRVADDVTKTVSADTAEPGDTLTYTIHVDPNVTNQDLEYTITDTIPDGLTYVGGSATGSPTVNGNELEWTVESLSPAQAPPEDFKYLVSVPSTNAACDTPFGGYTNLEDFGISAQSGIVGDTQLFTAFSTANPIDFYGDTYAPGVSFSDDGFIMFDTSGYGGSPWSTQELPDAAIPNGLLTMLWQDFEFVYEASGPFGQSGVSLATAGDDLRLIEWDNVRFYQDTGIPATPVLDMEIFILDLSDTGPEFVVAFDGVDDDNVQWGYDNFQDYSIGVENNDGDMGLSYLYGDPAAALAEGFICFDWDGPVFDPVEVSYEVTVDVDVPLGVITNDAVHITDNPNDMEATATADVLIVDPARTPVANDDGPYEVDFGGSITKNAPGVLGNDTDPDGVTLTAEKLTNPAHGTVTLSANGKFVYTHDGADESGSDSFTYRVKDSDGYYSGAATVSFTIGDKPVAHTTGLVDMSQGVWHRYDANGVETESFYYGNPGDYPFMGDWNGDGVETPGLYRQSDGFVYLRNSNTQGIADIKFFFGNPGDVPIAGDFDGDGFDTVGIYRPSNQTFYIINKLGANNGGLGAAEKSYVFGNPGDKPFVGDFNGDGMETAGLHRESTGLVYFRNSHSQGNADKQFIFGDPGDRLVAGDWNADGMFSPALFRPSNTTMYFRYTNTQGNANKQFVPPGASSTWYPVSGEG